jgi:membrane-associated phospholipid phosphatase
MQSRYAGLFCALCATLLAAAPARAGGGLLGLDTYVTLDNRGIWARKNQQILLDVMIIGDAGLALWEGGDSRLGRTSWQSVDAAVVGTAAAEVMKFAFSRARPSATTNPDLWFQGSGNQSFPSGEATITSAIVTPFVLQYRHDHPAVYLLELLPIYDSIARVKVHGHWPSDVIVGFALGTAAGYFMEQRTRTPLILSVMPHGIYVGISRHLDF